MKKSCSFLLLIVFLISMLVSISYSKSTEEKVIVVFKENIDQDLIKSNKGKIKKEFKSLNSIAVDIPSSEISKLKKNSNVIRVEPDVVLKTSAQVLDWGIQKVKPVPELSFHLTGEGISIAVVDTGISPHQELNVMGGISTVQYTSSYSDDNGHGTHVAGIIGAADNDEFIAGMAPKADLFSVKAFDENGNGYLSDVIEGIDWAIMQKADIINLSFGTSQHSQLLEYVLNKAYNEGILIVGAAGNRGNITGDNSVEYPAKYSSVIAVTSITSNNKRSSFSAVGSEVEVAAPGDSILSTGLNNDVVTYSGTSMAAAFVSGNLALLKQEYTNESAVQIRSRLQQNVVDIGPVGKDNEFGYGLVLAPFNMVIEQEEQDKVESDDAFEALEDNDLNLTIIDKNQTSNNPFELPILKTMPGSDEEMVSVSSEICIQLDQNHKNYKHFSNQFQKGSFTVTINGVNVESYCDKDSLTVLVDNFNLEYETTYKVELRLKASMKSNNNDKNSNYEFVFQTEQEEFEVISIE